MQVGWRVHVPIRVTVRDLDRLAELAADRRSTIPDVVVEHVRWEVDPRNPAWPLVRAAAIQDAIAKARDYASALGGEVTALVHVADEGLLGGAGRLARATSGASTPCRPATWSSRAAARPPSTRRRRRSAP